MASKFGVTFPFFASSAQTAPRSSTAPTQNKPASAGDRRTVDDANTHFQSSHHTKAAAAPLWSLVFIFVPIGVAVYIGATRYFDYYHHGFDVLSGSLIGVATGYFGFCWYHGPLGQTRGLAWSPRSRDRAFGVSVGNYGYVVDAESKGKEPVQSEEQDLELGPLSTSSSTRPILASGQEVPVDRQGQLSMESSSRRGL